MKSWYLILTAAAVASAVTYRSPITNDCIDNCDCTHNYLGDTIRITSCDRPLTLNESTFHVFKRPGIHIATISFENVIIDQIQEDAFTDMDLFRYLEDVLFLKVMIGSIDDKAFNNIKKIKFEDCGLEDSPELSSEKLEELHFGSCHLEQIPKLNGLINLRFLNLSGNYIKDVGIETFAGVFTLEELHLSNNEIFKLPPTLFINNQNLDTLNLDNNPLQHFYLNTSVPLEILSIKNCKLETFDERATHRLSTLSELNLSNNKIKSISGKAFAHMVDLSNINLSYNQLEKLDGDVFAGNSELKVITLDGNKFTTLPNFFLNTGETFNTNMFSCKYCGLKTLSNTVFQQMSGLIDLRLSHNKFTNVENLFQKITSLKVLDISYNNIDYFEPSTFNGNRNLENLNIAGNSFVVLNPEVFGLNGVLKVIDARNASLERLWSNRNVEIISLNKLFIGNNKLTSLTIDDFTVMPKLESVDLNNNPLVFSDTFCDVINWLDEVKVKPINYIKNISYGDGKYYDNLDGISFMNWREFYGEKCPESEEIVTSFKPFMENEALMEDDFELDRDDKDDSTIVYDESDDEYDDYDAAMNSRDAIVRQAELTKYLDDNEYDDLDRASYILSVTSVFILTALVVLTLAVTITLAILRRNSNFNMHKANLPRFKIPLWNTAAAEKKHSGSVYRPLSEDLSGPKTPKLSRYEFASTPTVHSSNP